MFYLPDNEVENLTYPGRGSDSGISWRKVFRSLGIWRREGWAMLDRLGIERRMSKHANHGSAHPTPAEVKLVMAEHHRIKGERVIRKSLLGEELEQKRAFEKRRSTRGLKGYALHRVFSLPEQVTQPSTIDHVPSLGRL